MTNKALASWLEDYFLSWGTPTSLTLDADKVLSIVAALRETPLPEALTFEEWFKKSGMAPAHFAAARGAWFAAAGLYNQPEGGDIVRCKWVPLAERMPTEKGTYLLHHPSYLHEDFPGHPFTESNPEYIRANGIEHGYTHWAGPIERPDWMVHELERQSPQNGSPK